MRNKDKLPNNDVGYGKPPRATQFPKGKSGNPKGRPKGSPNSATVFQRELRRRVVINEGGRRKTVTLLDAATKQLTNKAAKGDLQALKLLLSFVRAGEEREALQPPVSPKPNETDEKLMKDLAKRYSKTARKKRKQK